MKHFSSWLTGAVVSVGAGLGGGGGCGDTGSIGPYDGSSGSEDDSGTEGSSVSATSVSGTASATFGDTDTTASGSSGASETFDTEFTATLTETGETDTSVSACDQPGNCEMFPAPCGDSCGTVVSPFDAEGCLRAACIEDGECGGDERCFRGLDYGLCQASGVACADSPQDEACVCVSNPDCGGGHCMPAALIPEIELEPDISGGVVSTGCSPNDAPSLVLTIYGDGSFSDCVAEDATVELQFEFYRAQPEVGTYEFTLDSGGVGFHRGEGGVIEAIQLGRLVIDAIDVDAGVVSGTYEAVVMQDGALRVYGGELDELSGGGTPFCPGEMNCG